MSSKIATWKWRGTTYTQLVVGGVTTDSLYTAPGNITRIDFSTTDSAGASRIEELKAIGQDAIIEIIPDGIKQGTASPSVDAGLSWTLRVSGEPSVETSPVPFYKFPVASVSSTAGAGFGVGNQDNGVVLYGPSYGGTAGTTSYTSEGSYFDVNVNDYTSRSRMWDTREGNIRKQMYKMTHAQNNISHIYKELLRAMIASFSDVGYISSEDKFIHTKCVHANAERTVAKLKEDNNIILPILSVAQTVSNNDKEREKVENLLVHEKYWDTDKARAFRVVSFAPRAVNVMYQLNVWTKYMSDMDQILEQVRLKFNPEMEVPTKFSTLAKGFIDTEENIGKLSAGDKEDRILQKTINITVRTYIPSPKFLVTSGGKIEKFLITS